MNDAHDCEQAKLSTVPMERAAAESVPNEYLGVWRRDWIRRANGAFDDTSTVIWMQSARFHVDLRVSGGAGAARVLDGFAGCTEVTGNRCEWKSTLHVHPAPKPSFGSLRLGPPGTCDIGIMTFVGADTLLELGDDASYQEQWRRLPNSTSTVSGFRMRGTTLRASGYLICCGEFAAIGFANNAQPATIVMWEGLPLRNDSVLLSSDPRHRQRSTIHVRATTGLHDLQNGAHVEVAAGDEMLEFIIEDNDRASPGVPIARLGIDRGAFEVPDDFNDPMLDEELK
jgi:hypothetical protein